MLVPDPTLLLIVAVCPLKKTRIHLYASTITAQYIRGARIILRKREKRFP